MNLYKRYASQFYWARADWNAVRQNTSMPTKRRNVNQKRSGQDCLCIL